MRSEWARRGEELGAGEILLTSMDTDGVQTGFDCALTRAVAAATTIPVIASGGAGTPQDFVEVLTVGPCRCRAGRIRFSLRQIHGGDLKAGAGGGARPGEASAQHDHSLY